MERSHWTHYVFYEHIYKSYPILPSFIRLFSMLATQGLIKTGGRPRPTRENGPDPIFNFFKVKFFLKLHLNDSGFSLGLVQKCSLFIVDEVGY